jgi:hypothetical protein
MVKVASLSTNVGQLQVTHRPSLSLRLSLNLCVGRTNLFYMPEAQEHS